MNRMFRVLGFWTGIFAVMFYLGNMKDASLLFFGQTVFFVFLSYLNLTERMYIYIFGAYLTVFFAAFTYYSVFIMVPGQEAIKKTIHQDRLFMFYKVNPLMNGFCSCSVAMSVSGP